MLRKIAFSELSGPPAMIIKSAGHRKEHVEPIHAQMECDEEGKATIMDIPILTDVPKYKAHTSMSKCFRDFETYLSQHYGVEGFPFNNAVHPEIAAV